MAKVILLENVDSTGGGKKVVIVALEKVETTGGGKEVMTVTMLECGDSF